jgi:hypothetical protein
MSGLDKASGTIVYRIELNFVEGVYEQPSRQAVDARLASVRLALLIKSAQPNREHDASIVLLKEI